MDATRRLRLRLTAAALLASVPVTALGITTLAGMYGAFALGERPVALALGRSNDLLVIVSSLLLVPAVIELHALTGPDRRAVRVLVAVVGLGGIASIVWLQFLLVTDRITFERQIGWVMLAFLVLTVWFVGGGRLASDAGLMPRRARLDVAAALYVGLPWWAWRWGRRLLVIADTGAVRTPAGAAAGVTGDQRA